MYYETELNKAIKADNVNHPSHYTQGGVECIDALEAATSGLEGIEAVCTANAIKYLWRWKRKNGVEDLRKAKWYIDKLIEKEKITEYCKNDVIATLTMVQAPINKETE